MLRCCAPADMKFIDRRQILRRQPRRVRAARPQPGIDALQQSVRAVMRGHRVFKFIHFLSPFYRLDANV